jgi:hypothetical protein
MENYDLRYHPMSVDVKNGKKVRFRGKIIQGSKFIDKVHCPKYCYSGKSHNKKKTSFDECTKCRCAVDIERNGVWCSFGQ